ncbi:MAG TPA: alpha/beta hydrolase [Caulobacteraceae bacterium]|nr:alpha/beta hydrolase [Caulobacteraceae bacterium]
MTASVVMVHGAFCGGWVFDDFRKPFEQAGYEVLTPDLIGHARGGRVAGLSMADYARQVADLCASLPQPPVLIGHSMGGLVAQLAAARTKVSALVLLAPSGPWGVRGASMEEAVTAMSLYALGPYWLQAIDPDYALAKLYSLDRMDQKARRAIFKRMAPESGLALWQTLNWWLDPFMTTAVPSGASRAPVLAIAGGRDVIHPPATVKQTAARLSGDLMVMREMSHWLPGEPGWEEVAQACLDWLPVEKRAAA